MQRGGSESVVVIVDNGAGNMKVGFGGESAPRRVFPHCTAKAKGERQALPGDVLMDCQEVSQLTLRRPHDRGYLVQFDLEREMWSRVFRSVLKVNPADAGLMVTEPMFNFPAAQAAAEQIAFEELGVRSFHAAPAPLFSMRRACHLRPDLPASKAGAGIVVDAGFSFTHVVPFFDGQPLLQGVKRINVGGKALTNYLKELVTFRSLNMMDETYLMETIKDQLCFVSQDVRADMKLCMRRPMQSPYRREFVLPDGVSNMRGYVKPIPQDPKGASAADKMEAQGQVLVLNNERFLVPEVAFDPRIVGLQQAGVVETVVQAVQSCHPSLAPLLYSNVILTGGLACCPGFRQRFIDDLRPMVDISYALDVLEPPSPALCAWEGMSLFVSSGQYKTEALTAAEYQETGGSLARGSQR